MIVTISDLNGIKQYNVSKNIKKFLLFMIVIIVVMIVGLWSYVKILSSKVSALKEKNVLIERKLQTKLLLQESIKLDNEKKQKERMAIAWRQKQEELERQKEEEIIQERKNREKKEQEMLARVKKEEQKLQAEKKAKERQKARLVKLNEEKKKFLLNRQLQTMLKSKLGKRYVWGATGPSCFDCSGFTSYIYRKKGITIPRTSSQQSRYGRFISRKNLKPGDLIFFDTSRHSRGVVNHVGIYIGDNKFIHASSAEKKVVITSLNKKFYNNRFKCARRVIH